MLHAVPFVQVEVEPGDEDGRYAAQIDGRSAADFDATEPVAYSHSDNGADEEEDADVWLDGCHEEEGILHHARPLQESVSNPVTGEKTRVEHAQEVHDALAEDERGERHQVSLLAIH